MNSNNLNNDNNSVKNSSELGENPAFVAAIAEKDAIIANLNSRIACLEQSILNQNAVLAQLNQNIIALNNNISDPTEGNSKRKKSSKFPSTDTGPIDRFLYARPLSSEVPSNETIANDVAMDDTTTVDGSTDELNQPHIPAATYAEAVRKGKSKPMPLQLGTADRVAINQIIVLLGAFEPGDFDFVQLKGGSLPRIFPKDAIIKDKIVRLFSDNKIEFNSYTEKNEKQQSFIVRGLNHGEESTNVSHICRSLAEVGILSAIDCSRFLTGHMKRVGESNNTVLYRFTLPPNTDLSSLTQIKLINGFRVTIEKMRKSVIIQCHRCQRFQHTAKQCSFEYRCVQCLNRHDPGCCPRKLNDKLPLRCCNCVAAGIKEANHTANDFNSCSYFKNKHSLLFNKFANSRQAAINKLKSERPDIAVPRPGSSSDTAIGPAHANNPHASHKKKMKNSNSTVPRMLVENKKSRGGNSIPVSKSTVNSGKSFSASTSGNSNHRVEALIGAFSKLLREFCNAS